MQHALAGPCHPVYHAAQVAEVADAETPFRAQREHRHQRAGAFRVVYREERLPELVNHHLAAPHRRQRHDAVALRLPQGHYVVVLVDGHELELERAARQLGGVDVDDPFVGLMLRHWPRLAQPPRAEHALRAHHGKAVVGAQLRRAHLQAHRGGVVVARHIVTAAARDALRECRAVQVTVFGHRNPVVVGDIPRASRARQVNPVRFRHPFVQHLGAVALNAVVVAYRLARLAVAAQVARPPQPVVGVHSVLCRRHAAFSVDDVQHKILAVTRLVVYVKL